MITGKIRKLLCYSLAIGGIMLTFSFWGCSKKTNNVDATTADNSAFGTMSDTEKQQYVHDYLLEEYGLDCDVHELSFRQVDVFHNEKHLHTTAFTEDGFGFSVWVHPRTGEIYDTAFTYFIKDDCNTYLENVLAAEGYSCRIKDDFFVDSVPEKTPEVYTPEEMFNLCQTYNVIYMNVLSPHPDLNNISNIFSNLNGIIYINEVEDLNDEFSDDYNFEVLLN